MNILAIETSTSAGSVAVVRVSDLRVLAMNEWVRGRSHAEVTTPALADALKISGGFADICAIAVDVGPGSFTGIRVGLNSAKTAAWQKQLPLMGFSSTSILLERVRESGLLEKSGAIVACTLNAQMGMVFSGFANESPRAQTPTEFVFDLASRMKSTGDNTVALVGDGVSLVEETMREAECFRSNGLKVRKLDPGLDHPHAATLGRMAAIKLFDDLKSNSRASLVRKYAWQSVQPLYLRGSGAEEKRR
jgi:tRNA threonylcarbamoyladenosine biosynthesis protein TsaB